MRLQAISEISIGITWSPITKRKGKSLRGVRDIRTLSPQPYRINVFDSIALFPDLSFHK